ncbi:MAG: right-handed parallel beta-helix repeat-containing protein [Armatimonadetes bacterium]|nr:right-handed parallel beta-helix repeat-containing protein [Armatimonadota bacterium]
MRKVSGAFLLIAVLVASSASADTVQATSLTHAQQLIDSASGPRMVLLPPGNQVMTAPLRLKSKIILNGNGSTNLIVPTNAGIQAIVGSGSVGANQVISEVDAENRRLTFAAPHGFSQGDTVQIEFTNGVDWIVDKVAQVIDANTIQLHQRFVRQAVGQNVRKATPLYGIDLMNFRVTGSTNPVWITDAEGVTVNSVVMVGAQLSPVIYRSSTVAVLNTTLDTVGGGWSFLSCTGVVFQFNTAVKHQRAGFFFRAVTNGVANNNNCQGIPGAVAFGGNGDGFTVCNSQDVQADYNDVRHTSCYGTWVLDSDNVSMTGNKFLNTYTTAMYLLRNKDVVLDGNSSSTNAIGYGFTLDSNVNITLTNNLAYQVPRGLYAVNNMQLSVLGQRSVSTQYPDYYSGNQ